MSERRIDFSRIDWEEKADGLRTKNFETDGKRFRFLEISRGLVHPDWCVTGHIGYVVEGELEIDFGSEIINYSAGDALFIKAGEREKHIPKPVSEKVLLFLVEEI